MRALRLISGDRKQSVLRCSSSVFRREAGSLFLILPSGEVLKNGEREQWMLQPRAECDGTSWMQEHEYMGLMIF